MRNTIILPATALALGTEFTATVFNRGPFGNDCIVEQESVKLIEDEVGLEDATLHFTVECTADSREPGRKYACSAVWNLETNECALTEYCSLN
jgi:hypothetical protein